MSRRIQAGLMRLLSIYPTQVRLVTKHFLLNFHERGQAAAEAALAAGRQGRYWEYRLFLFAHQDSLQDEDLLRYAIELGLDGETFERDRRDALIQEIIRREHSDAVSAGVRGTPTLFVNATRIDGAVSFDSLRQAVDRELALIAGNDELYDGGRDDPHEQILRRLTEISQQLARLRADVEALKSSLSDTPPSAPEFLTAMQLEADDPSLGSSDARLAVVEFSEFQCPFCRQFHEQTFAKLKSRYIDTGKVLYVFRDLPLGSIHPEAKPAAIAANCAGRQGAFWGMHHELFLNQNRLGSALYTEVARKLELDEASFRSCLVDAEIAAEIDRDVIDAARAGIQGTPNFLVGRVENGGLRDIERIGGAQPIEAFFRVLDRRVGGSR
jgi:protein-disulfide isomerase